VHIAAHSLSVDLPQGWDGRIYARRVETAGQSEADRSAASTPQAATLHAANFALPGQDADFGTKATAGMSVRSVFLALTEYVEGNGLRAGRGLFEGDPPQALRAEMFSPETLLLARPGQVGCQHFFTQRNRPFCLYVVLGSLQRVPGLLPSVNSVLASMKIDQSARER
jgi:hypothetical protein